MGVKKEELEVTPTKAGVIVRLICYPLFLFPLVAFIVYIGIKEAKADPGKWMILWLLFLIVFAVFFVWDFCESIIGYFHRCLVLTEAECYYINSFGKKKKFVLLLTHTENNEGAEIFSFKHPGKVVYYTRYYKNA